MKKGFLRILRILLGSLSLGAGISLFVSPNGIVPGGVTGLAIMINRFLPVGVGSITFLVNIPLLYVAYRRFGKRFFSNTLFALAASSISIDLFAIIKPVTTDLVLAALAGGGLVALGVGTIFRNGATTGGVDIVVRLLKQKFPHIKTGNVFLMVDGAIAVLSGLVFKNPELSIYSLLAIGVSSAVLNFVLYGADEARLMIIITQNPSDVKNVLVTKLGAGVSLIKATGGFSGEEKGVLICAVRNQSFYKAKDMVSEADSRAFLIVSSATAIYGEGFKAIDIEEM